MAAVLRMPSTRGHYPATPNESENFCELEAERHGRVFSYRHEEPADPQYKTAVRAHERIAETGINMKHFTTGILAKRFLKEGGFKDYVQEDENGI